MRHLHRICMQLFVLGLSLILLSGCADNASSPDKSKTTVSVITTLFPLYDFAREIGGEYVNVKSIIPAGSEPHDFEPSAKDMIELHRADLFVYNGAGYEAWVEKAIENINPEKTLVVDASAGLTLLDGSLDGHGEGLWDPHVWLDPLLAKEQAEMIYDALVQIDPKHQQEYQANFNRLSEEFLALDQAFKETLSRARKDKVVVSHKAYSYLAKRYGFDQIPVSGLTPSDEPSQKEIMELISFLKEHEIRYVAFDSLTENKLSETVQREAGAEAVLLYTIENATREQLQAGLTYFDFMRENLNTLKKVLEVQ